MELKIETSLTSKPSGDLGYDLRPHTIKHSNVILSCFFPSDSDNDFM